MAPQRRRFVGSRRDVRVPGPGSWIRRRTKAFIQVGGVEEIRTPAGSFRAYRLHSIWRWFSDAGGALGHSGQEDWLSAQVRFYVMGRWKEGADSGDYELVEYTLAP